MTITRFPRPFVVVLQLASLLAAPAAIVGAQDLPQPSLALHAEPNALASGDLNGDGRADFVASLVAAPGEPDVSLVLSLPQGGWAQPVGVETLKNTSDVAVGLLETDGLPDVVVCHWISASVSVLRGTGGGAFLPPVPYFVGTDLRTLRLGDMNGDGRNDLVTLSSGQGGSLKVNLADGGSGFLGALSVPAGGIGFLMELADMNVDGDLDAVVGHTSADIVSVLLGDGTGHIGNPLAHFVGGHISDVDLADADQDGLVDALVAHNFGAVTTQSLSLLSGNGEGGLLPAVGQEVGGGAIAADVADVDGDDVPDLLATVVNLFAESSGPSGVTVLRGLGGGTFAPHQDFRCAANPQALLAVDADADGDVDAVTLQLVGHAIAVLRGDGQGRLESQELHDVARPASLEVADFDGDQQPDVLVAVGQDHALKLLRGDGRGGLLAPESYPVAITPQDARAGDFDGDGALDAITAGTFPSSFALLRGDGQGGLLAPSSIVPAPNLLAQEVEVADVDGDGDLDALGAGPGNSITGFTGRVRVLLGDGAGGLQSGAEAVTGFYTLDLASGDLDGDGTPDAVLANRGSDDLTLVHGDGAGGLLAPLSVPAGDTPRGVALADFDLDGVLDAVAVNDSAWLALLLGDGAGGLLAPTIHASVGDSTGYDVAAADLDGDGAPDVAVPEGLQRVAIWQGDGQGGLAPPQRFQASTLSSLIALSDLDGDARPDVLVGHGPTYVDYGSIAVLRNQTLPFTWADLGFALAGTLGEPALTGQGELVTGTPGALTLHHARPLSLAVLFVAAQSQPLPFKGGTLVPLPALAQFALASDAAGSIGLGWPAWPGSAPGQSWYFQYGVADTEAPHGVALSNALRATEP